MEHEGMITVIKELGEIIAGLRDRIDYLKWEIEQHNKNRTHDKEKIAELEKSKAKWQNVAEQLTEKNRNMKGNNHD